MWRPLKGEPAGRRPQGSADNGVMLGLCWGFIGVIMGLYWGYKWPLTLWDNGE